MTLLPSDLELICEAADLVDRIQSATGLQLQPREKNQADAAIVVRLAELRRRWLSEPREDPWRGHVTPE